MAKNDFKAFAIDQYANVLSQEEYEALEALKSGFSSGIARSEQLNKVWRQASTIAAVVASFMADKSGDDVLDNGDVEGLEKTLVKALLAASRGGLDTIYLQAENNLSELTDKSAARINLGLSKVGNYRAVQANGGKHSSGDYSIYMDWGSDGKVYITVGSIDAGAVFTTRNPPNAQQTGAYPLADGSLSDWLTGIVNTINNVASTTNDAWNKANDAQVNRVADVALGARWTGILNPSIESPAAGYVMTGWYTEGQNPGGDTLVFRPIQKYLPSMGWVNVGHTA
ncbi:MULTISPECIES: hypothetical protein [unclassified Pantoea]|uniref:hypothetical protein n=1 Tax=unclassified Pantoea TaxID=2630326 RepID=UPI00204F7942|nr:MULTISPECIES: hypothetical protein [unclassified Pantoea]MDU5474035.1 hypothetical protein [Pantoea sp.]DAI70379.1 MAG TPA: hypothetical protein [Bacteriophage sp.]